MSTHHRCGATWGGVSTAHCAGCCQTFNHVDAFVAHRKGGKCLTPAATGLVQTSVPYPCFGFPTAAVKA